MGSPPEDITRQLHEFRREVSFKGSAKRSFIRFMGNVAFSPYLPASYAAWVYATSGIT